MKRTVLAAALSAVVFASSAIASPQLILRVPVEIDGLPAAVTRGQLECSASSGATFDPTRIRASGIGVFAIEGGRYSGRVGVALTPGGYPAGTDGTTDLRSYHCAIVLMFRCTSSSGAGLGWCASSPGGLPGASAPAASAAMFATDPARPPVGVVEGVIDRSTATTLPTRR